MLKEKTNLIKNNNYTKRIAPWGKKKIKDHDHKKKKYFKRVRNII